MPPQPRSPYDNGRKPLPVLDRIRARCIVNERGCWIWQGHCDKGGYGQTKVGSRRDGTRKGTRCHIATFEAKYGPVPEGMTLDHIECDTPPCCNPDHVAPRTIWQNTERSQTSPTAVNARKPCCPQCGGEFTLRPDGHRYCRPCYLAYLRDYNARRPKALESPRGVVQVGSTPGS